MKGRPSRPRQPRSERPRGNEREMNVTLKSKAGKINERAAWKSPGPRAREGQTQRAMDGWGGWMDGWMKE